MKKCRWTFLNNHGRVFAYVAKYPQTTTRQIASKVGITERAVQKVIKDLVSDGYIVLRKAGRNNNYEVNPDLPMRHPLEKDYSVTNLLNALGCDVDSQ